MEMSSIATDYPWCYNKPSQTQCVTYICQYCRTNQVPCINHSFLAQHVDRDEHVLVWNGFLPLLS